MGQTEDAQYAILLIADFSSIIGCLIVLIGFWRLKLLRNHITKVITFFCSTSLAKDLISTILTLQTRKQNNGDFSCYLYATVITYGSLSCWLWTLCLSFSIYNLIVKREPEPEKFERYYHGICWVIPFICTVIMLSKNIVSVTGNWCWIGNSYVGYRFGLFYGPFLAIWFFAALLVGLTSRYTYIVIRSSVSDNKDKHLTYQFKLINYIIVFLVCWIFAVVNRIVNGLNMYPPWLNIVHTYLSVSHGFYASVTFIYNNPLMWRYLLSIILIPFVKFGYFTELKQRLEKNKNNNNQSPVGGSSPAHGEHNQNNINYNQDSSMNTNNNNSFMNTSYIESFSLQNETGTPRKAPLNSTTAEDNYNINNNNDNNNKYQSNQPIEIEPIQVPNSKQIELNDEDDSKYENIELNNINDIENNNNNNKKDKNNKDSNI